MQYIQMPSMVFPTQEVLYPQRVSEAVQEPGMECKVGEVPQNNAAESWAESGAQDATVSRAASEQAHTERGPGVQEESAA